jgi:excisionase family DNA binding protein
VSLLDSGEKDFAFFSFFAIFIVGLTGEHEMNKYTIEEIAEILGVARKVVDKLVKSGELGSVKIGARHFVLPRHLDEYMQSIGVDVERDGEAESLELDANGHPWNPQIHSATKAKTSLGYWRKRRTVRNTQVDVLAAVNAQLKQSQSKQMTLREEQLVVALLEVLGH